MPALIGAVLGLVVVAFAAAMVFSKDRSFYPTVLIVIAAYYVLFAIMDGRASTIAIEIAIALVFCAVAVVGYKRSPWLVAAGIFAHGVQDAFHMSVVPNHGVPVWWPAFCGTIDVCIGMILAWLMVRQQVSPNVQDPVASQS